MVCFMAAAVVKKTLPKGFAILFALDDLTVQIPHGDNGERH